VRTVPASSTRTLPRAATAVPAPAALVPALDDDFTLGAEDLNAPDDELDLGGDEGDVVDVPRDPDDEDL